MLLVSWVIALKEPFMKLHSPTKIIALGAAIWLAGCATTSPMIEAVPRQELNIEENWAYSQVSDVSLTDSLLALFDDAALKGLVTQSQTSNFSLLQQKSATEAIAATLTQAEAALAPSLGTQLSSQRTSSGSDISNSHNLTLDASWELDIWGRWRAERDVVLNNYQASSATYQYLKDSIAAQTMQAYINAVSQSRLANVREESFVSFGKTLSVVESQYQVGTAELNDLTEARQNLASAEVSRISAQLQQRNAVRALQALVGEYPNGLDQLGTDLPAMLAPPKAEVPANVIASRPDIQSAWYSVQSSVRNVDAKMAAKLPNISLTAELGRSSDALRDLLSGDTLWSLAASIGYTLFDSGALKAQVTESQRLAEQSYYQYLEVVQTALSEVETALDSERSYYNNEIAQREVVEQARLLLANAEQDYRDGLIDMTDWLVFQRSYFNEQSTLIDTINLRLQNRVSLGLALGLGV